MAFVSGAGQYARDSRDVVWNPEGQIGTSQRRIPHIIALAGAAFVGEQRAEAGDIGGEGAGVKALGRDDTGIGNPGDSLTCCEIHDGLGGGGAPGPLAHRYLDQGLLKHQCR